jgi:elongation factor P
VVSVIASSVRKGNVIEKDGKLYLVITAENIHPGKGTPVTHLEMRRISDGVKTVERLRTTDSIEKAFVEHQNFQYLYQDGEQYVFMNPVSFAVMKGQTASGSFKPAMLSNGVRTMVPTHIVAGTRIVVMTEDGAYVERAKD